MTSVTIPNSVTRIDSYAFYGCSGLTSVTIPDSITAIYSYTFCGCNNLTNVTIPNSVTQIGDHAFAFCSDLTKILLPNSVTILFGYVFYGCSSLESVSIGTGIKAIGEYTFKGCSSLLEINIPCNVKNIGDYVFENCTSLANVTIADRETELNLGSNGKEAMFADCPLNTVYIGGKIIYDKSSSKGYSPFYRNTSLRTVVITDNETEIYDNEFYGCTNLKDVKIGDGVKKIGNWAFSGCSNLDYFAFGTNVENIGEETFSDCTNVGNIISYSVKPPKCGTQALDDINKWNCTLKVLDNSVTAYQSADQWKEFFFVESLPIDGKVATPVIKLDNKTITITCETPKVSIFFTLDGTNPTVESTLYSGPLTLEKNCTIKAVATRINYENSDISMLEVTTIKNYATLISLNQTKVSLEESKTVTLVATVLPESATNKSVEWSSSDETVAVVDENGMVTAVSVGEATITATTTDGTNLSASCKVTVKPTLATSITLDKTEISLEVTETTILVATILPKLATNKSVTWSSSNESIATVDENGVVTAIAVGESTITVTTTDDSGLSASCKVTVNPTLATSIMLDKTEVELEATQTATLVAVVLPELATNKSVTWSSSNESIATVDENGVVTAIAVGESTITVTTTDGSDFSASCQVTVVPTLVVSIEVTPNSVDAEENSEVQLSVNILPENATYKSVEWSSSNDAIASVNANGLVKIRKEGNVVITATTTDGTNLSATCCINVYTGINGVNGDDVIVATIGDNIVVKNAPLGRVVNVYASNGALIASEVATDSDVVVEAPVKGVYIVKVGKQTVKVII